MIVYKDHATFIILGEEVHLFSDILDHGQNTVAEVGFTIHYLGKESPSLAAAILAWQEVHGRELTDDELREVLDTNQFSSGTV